MAPPTHLQPTTALSLLDDSLHHRTCQCHLPLGRIEAASINSACLVQQCIWDSDQDRSQVMLCRHIRNCVGCEYHQMAVHTWEDLGDDIRSRLKERDEKERHEVVEQSKVRNFPLGGISRRLQLVRVLHYITRWVLSWPLKVCLLGETSDCMRQGACQVTRSASNGCP